MFSCNPDLFLCHIFQLIALKHVLASSYGRRTTKGVRQVDASASSISKFQTKKDCTFEEVLEVLYPVKCTIVHIFLN